MSSAESKKEIEAEIEARLRRVAAFRLWQEGTPDEAAAAELRISPDEFRALKAQVVSEEARRIIALKPEEVYTEYLAQMRRIIADCMRLRRMAARAGSFGAAVQALKIASDTIDRSIARGQELGLITANSKTSLHLHAHMIAQLDNRALRSLIVHEVDAMRRLVGSSSDVDFLDMTEADVIESRVVDIAEVDNAPQEDSGPNRGALGDPSAKGRPAFARGGPAKAAAGREMHRRAAEKARAEVDELLDRG